jgi:hypothetical protein
MELVITCGFLLELDLLCTLVQLLILLELIFCQSTNHTYNNGFLQSCSSPNTFLHTALVCCHLATLTSLHSTFNTHTALYSLPPQSETANSHSTCLYVGAQTGLQAPRNFSVVLEYPTLFWVTWVPAISLRNIQEQTMVF